jgi:hypothetical protein
MMPADKCNAPKYMKRDKHDEVGAKDHAEASANPEQAPAAPEADPKGIEGGVKPRQQCICLLAESPGCPASAMARHKSAPAKQGDGSS